MKKYKFLAILLFVFGVATMTYSCGDSDDDDFVAEEIQNQDNNNSPESSSGDNSGNSSSNDSQTSDSDNSETSSGDDPVSNSSDSDNPETNSGVSDDPVSNSSDSDNPETNSSDSDGDGSEGSTSDGDNSEGNVGDGDESENDSGYKYFTAEQIESANTAKDCSYMTEEEKLVVFYSNLARIDGAAFYKEFLPDLGKTTYQQSLITDLENTKDKPLLIPAEGLYNAAKAHCDDMNENNYFGHSWSDGTSTWDNIKKYYTASYACAENISAGCESGFDTVVLWLIDENTPSLGHRKAILCDPTYPPNPTSKVGIARSSHPKWRYVWTMDFAK